MRLGVGLEPFQRLPYVQAVDTSSATVLWRARVGVRDSFAYRPDGDDRWRAAAVELAPEGPGPAGDFRTRSVRLSGLDPGAPVSYRVWAGETEAPGAAFRTSPRPGSRDPVRVLAFGDSGWGSTSQVRLARLMEERDWDLAVHMGDIAYQRGTERDYTIRHFHVYGELLARVPFFPSAGDHDLKTEEGGPYARAFRWPAPAPGARYYDFRWGGVHFLALDTSLETEEGERLREGEGKQIRWLEAALDSAASDPTVRWTVVFMHNPLYSHAMGLSGHGSDLDLRDAVEPLFDRYGVDLVLSGHDHHYERTYSIQDGEWVRAGCGPVYIVSGGAGASRYARSFAPSPLVARASREHHFVRLVIHPETIEGEAIDTDGEVLDSFRLFPVASWERVGPGCEP